MSDTDMILQCKYPAKAHCRRVGQYLIDQGLSPNGIIYLEAQKVHMVEDDDQAMQFRQRRPFFYLSGCKIPEAYVIYDIPKEILTLFIPPIDPEVVVWAGLPESKEEALKKYDIDKVRNSAEVNDALATYSSSKYNTIYAIDEQISNHISFLTFAKTNTSSLKTAIDECRVVKDSYEVALIKRANEISILAHIEASKVATTATNEQEIYGAFIGTCISNGAPEQAYHSVCASGTSCATLHYIRNDQPLKDGLNILLDAGAEYECYCADITRTFPISGIFTPESKIIYDIVDDMQSSCFKMLKANVLWEDVHKNAHWVAIRGLLQAGILVGDEQEIFDNRISMAFFPHGLGHYLGLDTHDTGGHARLDDPDTMFGCLRVRGRVPAGAVITVEPGIYFCNFILDPVLADPEQSKFINQVVLERYLPVGGVRIEDNIHITENGFENLTNTPKL